MVYEESCGVCKRPKALKSCRIRGTEVCYNCCVECELRSKCDLRVWFYNLKTINSLV